MTQTNDTGEARSESFGKARAAYYVNGVTSLANVALTLALCAGALVCAASGAFLLAGAFTMGTLTQGTLAYHSYTTFRRSKMLEQRPLEAAQVAARDLNRGLICASLTPFMLVFNLSAAIPAALVDIAARALPDISQSSTHPAPLEQDKDQSEWKRLPLPQTPPSVLEKPPMRLRTGTAAPLALPAPQRYKL